MMMIDLVEDALTHWPEHPPGEFVPGIFIEKSQAPAPSSPAHGLKRGRPLSTNQLSFCALFLSFKIRCLLVYWREFHVRRWLFSSFALIFQFIFINNHSSSPVYQLAFSSWQWTCLMSPAPISSFPNHHLSPLPPEPPLQPCLIQPTLPLPRRMHQSWQR